MGSGRWSAANVPHGHRLPIVRENVVIWKSALQHLELQTRIGVEFDQDLMAAAELNVSQKHLRRAIARGELKHHRFGRAVRIAREDLEAYIRMRRR